MTDTMTPEEAYEIVLEWADCVEEEPCPPPERVREAHAVLREHHAYFSRFKPGDEVWSLYFADEFGWQVNTIGGDPFILSGDIAFGHKIMDGIHAQPVWESDCFPTRAEAEAECERRNQEGRDG